MKVILHKYIIIIQYSYNWIVCYKKIVTEWWKLYRSLLCWLVNITEQLVTQTHDEVTIKGVTVTNSVTDKNISRELFLQATVHQSTFQFTFVQRLKWFCEAGGHLTKPSWSKPYTHSNPTNLALFRRKIALYRFNQGAHTIAGVKWEQGAEPPHFNHCFCTTTRASGNFCWFSKRRTLRVS